MNRILFVSDVHLGAESPEREDKKESLFLEFLDYARQEAEELFVLGDLFEFWFEYRQVIPNKHFAVLAKLGDLVKAGVKVSYLTGNHDLWLGGFLQDSLGVRTVKGALEMEREDRRFHLFHGDGILARDTGYRIMKRVIGHPVNIFLYRLIHPDLGIPLAKLASHSSRLRNVSRADLEDDAATDAEYVQYAQARFDEGFDFVIMGHTHRAMLKNHIPNIYMNVGSWMEYFDYGEYSGGELFLRNWEH